MKNSSVISLDSKSKLLPLVIIIILSTMIFFACLGQFSLFNPDEGLYAEPAREMLETGQYITTTLNYVVRFTKPPLVIWLMALAYKIFGINEFAARIFCAASGFLLTIITYLFTNKYLGNRAAIFAACILLTSPLFIGVGRMAITDMPLSLFMAGSLFSFFHAWQQKKKLWLYLGYILTAFAIMTKGPVGLLLPVLILSVFFYLCNAHKDTLKFFNLPLGILLVSLIALPWFVIEIAITHGAYFQEFIMRENFARFTTVVDSHKGPWFYHILAVCGGLFPWTILLPQSIITLKNNIAPTINMAVKAKSGLLSKWQNCCQNLTASNQLLLFAFIFSAITIFFFSISVSKLLPYTLPCFPALAVLIAYQWDTFVQSKQSKSIIIYCLIISLFYLVATCISPFALKFLRDAPPDLITLIFRYAGLSAAIAIFCTLIAARKHLLLSSLILFVATTVTSAIFLPQFLTTVCTFWEGDIRQYAKFAGMSKNPLIVYKLRKPGIPFYFGRKVIQLNDKDELATTTSNLGTCYLITNCKHLADTEASGFKILAKKDPFALLSSEK